MLGADITLKVLLKLSMEELKMLVIAIIDNTHNVLVNWLTMMGDNVQLVFGMQISNFNQKIYICIRFLCEFSKKYIFAVLGEI